MNKLKFEIKMCNKGTVKAYVSGIYKCVKYGDKYFAYYKPKGWLSWDNHCFCNIFNETISYDTLKEAKNACNRHYTFFNGEKIYSNIGTIKI